MERAGWQKTTFVELRTAAEIAGVSTRHYRRIVASESIQVIRLGRKAVLLTEDVQKLEQRRGRLKV
jgi:hypothetical protein